MQIDLSMSELSKYELWKTERIVKWSTIYDWARNKPEWQMAEIAVDPQNFPGIDLAGFSNPICDNDYLMLLNFVCEKHNTNNEQNLGMRIPISHAHYFF